MATNKSNKELAREILDQIHAQNLADIEAKRKADITEMEQGYSNAVARSGMNYSSLYGSLSNEGAAKINTESERSRNLENISNSQNILAWLKEYEKPAGSGGSGSSGPTALPTRAAGTATKGVQGSGSGRSPTVITPAMRAQQAAKQAMAAAKKGTTSQTHSAGKGKKPVTTKTGGMRSNDPYEVNRHL